MKVTETPLSGVLVFELKQYSDDRGMFMETFNDRVMQEHGLPSCWRQDNFSQSRRNVVRGLHYQLARPQGKLVRVLFGAAWDVVVDIRRSSPTFGRHFSLTLRAEDGLLLWIPEGFAHGFAALTDEVGFSYKVNEYYSAADERAILWNDPQLAIAWPVEMKDAIVSGKDRDAASFAAAEVFA